MCPLAAPLMTLSSVLACIWSWLENVTIHDAASLVLAFCNCKYLRLIDKYSLTELLAWLQTPLCYVVEDLLLFVVIVQFCYIAMVLAAAH